MNKEELNDPFLAQKEAIKWNNERPDIHKTSFAEGFDHAMKLVKNHGVSHHVSIDEVRCKVCTKTLADSELFEKTCIHCGSEC